VIESAKKICGVTRGQKRKERDTRWWIEQRDTWWWTEERDTWSMEERDTWWWIEERDTWWWMKEIQQAVKIKKEVLKKWQKCKQDAALKADHNARDYELQRDQESSSKTED